MFSYGSNSPECNHPPVAVDNPPQAQSNDQNVGFSLEIPHRDQLLERSKEQKVETLASQKQLVENAFKELLAVSCVRISFNSFCKDIVKQSSQFRAHISHR